jgi:hypothetical protein
MDRRLQQLDAGAAALILLLNALGPEAPKQITD